MSKNKDLGQAIKEFKTVVNNEIIYPLLQPIFNYLAMRDTMAQLESITSPKYKTCMRIVSQTAKGLPREIRGAFIENISLSVKRGVPIDIAVGYALNDSIRMILISEINNG